jgi:hypothetical protein
VNNPEQAPLKSTLCPHCGDALQLKGKIIKVDGINKWIDEWHCSTHGAVENREETKRKS